MPILPPRPEAPTSRQLTIFVSIFVLAAAIAGAWLAWGSPFSTVRDKAKTRVESSQPVAPALPQLAACPSQPIAAVAGEKDGQFPLQDNLSGLIAADGATFIVIGKEAAAAGRTRDGEVAFLMSCRVADKLKGTGSLESVDAKYQLASHYSKIAVAAGAAAGTSRTELLRRAELLYSDSLTAYVAKYGEAHEKSRFAIEGLATVRQTLAQVENSQQPAPVVPMPEQSAQEAAVASIAPVRPPVSSTSRPPQATVPRSQGRQAEFAQAAPAEPPRPNATRQYRASFDCSRARSVPEKIICSDAELSRMDRDLGLVYARARNLASDRTAFRRQQQEEWRRREEICRDRECLLRWYTQRRFQLLDEINKAGAQAQPAVSRWGWSRGQDDALYRGR